MSTLTDIFGEAYEFKTLHAMEPHTGYALAYLLHELGYTDLFALSEANPMNIYHMPFIGPKRFEKIVRGLRSKGLDFDYRFAGPLGTPAEPPTFD
ncbi:MAG: helix-hairpin-helix domain-containing protein [Pseudomonadota bacterium]